MLYFLIWITLLKKTAFLKIIISIIIVAKRFFVGHFHILKTAFATGYFVLKGGWKLLLIVLNRIGNQITHKIFDNPNIFDGSCAQSLYFF